MGIIGNFNVYALMIIPLAIMIKGHKIALGSCIPLMIISSVLQLLLSSFASSLPAPLATLVGSIAAAFATTYFFSFVLQDKRSRQVLRLTSSVDGDAAATLATVWCCVNTALFRWFGWYHSMSSPGFEKENLTSGVDAFFYLVAILSAARRLQEGCDPNTQAAIAGSFVVGAVAQWATGLTGIQYLLAAVLLFFCKGKGGSVKEE
ncbi:hypothetical protein ADEAN_000762900 [Angomonas deanei]|uniref:Uncharacterized protein n=1 Tax=Angomonas deanei TaxID=59799 RepID=A0A7G2CMF8_9TRYP|nr:hypothetical protein ADEAN_000762900 [Angomonas deanei]